MATYQNQIVGPLARSAAPPNQPLHRSCELRGFTRGLDFVGPLAFIGLSQVRESATFSGIPIAERPPEQRSCGVWIVHIETGQTIGFVKFEEAVQEIFAVQLLHNARFPELVNDDNELLNNSFILPDEALADVPDVLQRPQPEKS